MHAGQRVGLYERQMCKQNFN